MSLHKIKVSVVVPTCDRQSLLLDTIKSIDNQSYLPYEIIVVDNGRKPSTIDSEDYSVPIKYVYALPRFGVSQARNLGSIMASGDYIAFLDDDDMWDQKYLEEISKTIKEKNPDIILGSLRDLDTKKTIESKSGSISDRNQFIHELLKRNPGAVGSNTIIRRETLFLTAGYDPYLITGQDKAVIFDLLLTNKEIKIARSTQAFVLFRQDFSIERQTETKKLLQGKRRFFKKYRNRMKLSIQFRVLIQIFILFVKKVLGK